MRLIHAIFLLGLLPMLALPLRGAEQQKIVCFGDSITAAKDGWVSLLAAKENGVTVVNAGRSGRKTTDKQELLPVLAANKDATTFIIFLGVNDLKDAQEPQIAGCVTNMEWMVTQIRAALPNARIVILAPSGINAKTMSPVNIAKKYDENTKKGLAELETRYKALAQRMNTGFISLLHVVSPPNYLDGLHPNSAGQQQIADAVFAGLGQPVGGSR
jgi:lysophospholipase L1-like esterase